MDDLIKIIVIIVIYYLLLFFIGTAKRNNAIVDIGWGFGFIIVSWYSLIISEKYVLYNILASILVSIWGFRLCIHIFKRNKGKPEDFRYANWRKEWGKYVILRSFFQVYILQGIFLFIVSSPIMLMNLSGNSTKNSFAITGVIIWLIGFYFESVGDYQLEQFKKDKSNKGKILDSGLWKYTRHPNYFGEATMWWGIGIISFFSGGGLGAFIGPATITYMLLFVSGVPMLEKSFEKREGYLEYKEKTSKFFPLPPKK